MKLLEGFVFFNLVVCFVLGFLMGGRGCLKEEFNFSFFFFFRLYYKKVFLAVPDLKTKGLFELKQMLQKPLLILSL